MNIGHTKYRWCRRTPCPWYHPFEQGDERICYHPFEQDNERIYGNNKE